MSNENLIPLLTPVHHTEENVRAIIAGYVDFKAIGVEGYDDLRYVLHGSFSEGHRCEGMMRVIQWGGEFPDNQYSGYWFASESEFSILDTEEETNEVSPPSIPLRGFDGASGYVAIPDFNVEERTTMTAPEQPEINLNSLVVYRTRSGNNPLQFEGRIVGYVFAENDNFMHYIMKSPQFQEEGIGHNGGTRVLNTVWAEGEEFNDSPERIRSREYWCVTAHQIQVI